MKNLVVFFGLFSSILFVNCAPDNDNESGVREADDSIDGFYTVHVLETEDSCNPDQEMKDENNRMDVLVQEYLEDGGYIVDIELGNLLWLDISVAPDGSFNESLQVARNLFYDIYGTVVPGELVATIEIVVYNIAEEYTKPSVACQIVYEIESYPMFW